MKENTLLITIPFSEYISILLRDNLFVNVPERRAKELAIIDAEEQFIHVQFEHCEIDDWIAEKFNVLKLSSPRVWNKRHWIESNAHWNKLKAESSTRRALYWLEQENIETIMYRLSRKMSLPPAIVKPLAERLVKNKDMNALIGLAIANDISFELTGEEDDS